MVRFGKRFILGALFALSLAAGTAPSAASNVPLGYQLFCLQHPAECKGGGQAKVSASNDVMQTLRRINNQVNRSIRPVAEGNADVWTVNARSGDCEDFVMTKRHALIRAGIPASSLRIAYVKTRDGQDHAILVVNTNGGKYVLDNLSNSVKLLSQTRYRVMSMQGADPHNWS